MPEQEFNTSGSPEENSTRSLNASPLDESKRLDEAQWQERAAGPSIGQISETPDGDVDLSKLEIIGRFHVIRQLGAGGFGTVFQAYDPRLKRQVAIKVPRRNIRLNKNAWRNFVDEAQVLAELDHPVIVKVHDVGELESGLPFVVMEYIQGTTFGRFIRRSKLNVADKLHMLVRICEGLQYVHKKGIVHCDLKPSNILIRTDGVPSITDFGLALRTDDTFKKIGTEAVGTLNFMSPEQIRGENHRLDARTDVWALGVIIYWLFGDQLPFKKSESLKTSDQICETEPLDLSQLRPDLPEGLVRICCRCMAKNKLDRYSNAGDVVTELRHLLDDLSWQVDLDIDECWEDSDSYLTDLSKTDHLRPVATAVSPRLPDDDAGGSNKSNLDKSQVTANKNDQENVKVIPKGLRSFDESDSEFFLNLLPGPKDYLGMPDSIRFWVHWATRKDPHAFGVIYGPSGCGKSSFVKAGLVPLLPANIDCIFLDCSSSNISEQLARQLAKRLMLPKDSPESLLELTNALRRQNRLNGAEKTVIVMDQFEQWLTTNSLDEPGQLILALRQCDGMNLQCLFLVRDEFWMPLQQLFGLLDSALQDGTNSLALPLLRRRGAKRILDWFGQAFEAFPENQTPSQKDGFLDGAVESLQIDNRIIPAHLTLFAEMLQNRKWSPERTERLGGWEGIGVQYLDELFSHRSQYHRDSPIAQRILELLLPAGNLNIKGGMKTIAEIEDALDSEFDRAAIQRTIDLLDQKMRLITRFDSEEWECGDGERTQYQLSHDILVAPIRKWLRRRQNETWQGRTASRLTDLTEQWNLNRHDRFLPTLTEYSQIIAGIPWRQMDRGRRALMNRATKYYWMRGLAVLAVLVFFLGWFFITNENQIKKTIEAQMLALVTETDVAKARQLVGSLGDDSLQFLKEINRDKNYSKNHDEVRFVLAEAELSRNSPLLIDSNRLVDVIPKCDPNEMPWIIELLEESTRGNSDRKQQAADRIQIAFDKLNQQPRIEKNLVGQAKYALALLHLNDDRILKEVSSVPFGSDPIRQTVAVRNILNLQNDASKLVDQIYVGQDPQVLSVILSAISQRFRADPTFDLGVSKKNFIEKLDKIITDSGTSHSVVACCKSTFHAMNEKIPELPDGQGRDFIRFSIGETQYTLVKIPKGSVMVDDPTGIERLLTRTRALHRSETESPEPRQLTIDSDFWIGESEITRMQMRDYAEHSRFPIGGVNATLASIPAAENMPVRLISQYRAMDFCNWLSTQAGLEPFYGIPENINLNDGMHSGVRIEFNAAANGFRLPNRFQIEYAARGGCGLKYWFGAGEYSDWLPEYAVVSEHGLLKREHVYSRLPNPFGLFGVIGNVREVTGDCLKTESKFGTNYYAYEYGGSVSDGFDCWLGNLSPTFAAQGYEGFRIILPLDSDSAIENLHIPK